MSLPKPPNRGASPNAAPLGPAADYRIDSQDSGCEGQDIRGLAFDLGTHQWLKDSNGGTFAAGSGRPVRIGTGKVRVALMQQAQLLYYSKSKHGQAFTTATL
jgi:hypothetical protein